MAITQTITTSLGTATFDATRAPQWQFTPSQSFTSELTADPAAKGYKNGDGTWKSSQAIGKLLTDPDGTIANPVSQPAIAKPFGYADIMALLSANSLANLRALPELARVLDDINNQNRLAVTAWANMLLAGANPPITQAEHDAIVALMQATVPDPSWPSTVPDVSRLEKVFAVGVVPTGLIVAVTGAP